MSLLERPCCAIDSLDYCELRVGVRRRSLLAQHPVDDLHLESLLELLATHVPQELLTHDTTPIRSDSAVTSVLGSGGLHPKGDRRLASVAIQHQPEWNSRLRQGLCEGGWSPRWHGPVCSLACSHVELPGMPPGSIKRLSLPTRMLPTPWTSLTR